MKNWRRLFSCTSYWGDLWRTAKHPPIYIKYRNYFWSSPTSKYSLVGSSLPPGL